MLTKFVANLIMLIPELGPAVALSMPGPASLHDFKGAIDKSVVTWPAIFGDEFAHGCCRTILPIAVFASAVLATSIPIVADASDAPQVAMRSLTAPIATQLALAAYDDCARKGH